MLAIWIRLRLQYFEQGFAVEYFRWLAVLGYNLNQCKVNKFFGYNPIEKACIAMYEYRPAWYG